MSEGRRTRSTRRRSTRQQQRGLSTASSASSDDPSPPSLSLSAPHSGGPSADRQAEEQQQQSSAAAGLTEKDAEVARRRDAAAEPDEAQVSSEEATTEQASAAPTHPIPAEAGRSQRPSKRTRSVRQQGKGRGPTKVTNTRTATARDKASSSTSEPSTDADTKASSSSSAKALGKRRAISPPSTGPSPSTPSASSGQARANKRRKLSGRNSLETPSPALAGSSYNLRSRSSIGAASSSSSAPSSTFPLTTSSSKVESAAAGATTNAGNLSLSPTPDGSAPGSSSRLGGAARKAKMPRKGKGRERDHHHSAGGPSNSLRAKAAANAAISAHNASGSSASHSAAHANAAPSAVSSSSFNSRRRRDPKFDTEELMGYEDDAQDDDYARADEDDDRDDEQEDMDIEEMDPEEAAEFQRAMDMIAEQEAAAAASQAKPNEGVERRTVGHDDDDDHQGPRDIGALGFHVEEEEQDDEGERDDDDEDMSEDDEIGGHEGDMLDDDFDVPLTFDADGNPLPPAGTTLAGESGAPTDSRRHSGDGVRHDDDAGDDDEEDEDDEDDEDAREAGLAGHLQRRAAARAAAAAAAGGLDDDDGFGTFTASLRGFSSLMGNLSSRFRALLASIKNKSDPSARLVALQELSELLAMSSEDTLAGYFQIDAFVKELVSCLRGTGAGMNPQAAFGLGGDDLDDDFALAQAIAASGGAPAGGENQDEIQLLACRCLANLIEAMPTASHNIVSNGAVPVLCSKLFEITFIDLAEQTISTLDKLAEETPNAIVREGGLSALLTYLDFFSTHVQRTALSAAAKCCHNLTVDAFNAVRDVMPILRNVLSYPDRKLVEQACIATTGVVESYRHHPEKLEILLTPDLLTAISALLVPGSANSTIDAATHPKILKLLSTAAKSSPEIAMSLIEEEIANTLYQLLTGVTPPLESEGIQGIKRHLEEDDMLVLNNLVHRSKEVVQETLALVHELLPALPKDGIFDPKAHMHRSSRHKEKDKGRVKKEEASSQWASTSTPSSSARLQAQTPTMSGAVPTAPSTSRRSSNRSHRSGRSTPIINDDGSITIKREEVTPALDSEPAGGQLSVAALSSASTSTHRAKDAAQEKRVSMFDSLESSGDEKRQRTVNRFMALLLPILLDVYSASIGVQIRSKTFQSMLKIVQYTDKSYLPTILTIVPMASFLASCFSTRDQPTLSIEALQMTELLLTKVPDTYQFFFRREGVLHELEKMAEEPLLVVSRSSRKVAAGASSASTPGASSPATPNPGNATPADDGGDTGDLGTRLGPFGAIANAAASKMSSTPIEMIQRDSVTLRARHLRDMLHDSTSAEGSLKADSALSALRGFVASLDSTLDRNHGVDHQDGVAHVARAALHEIAALFASSTAMSSFEMQESGLIDGLLRFATGGEGTALSNEDRRRLIMQEFMSRAGSSDPAFTSLVKRLQEALGKAEESEVITALPSGGDSRQNPATMLARQLKIRLVADDSSGIPKSVANVVVSIHAIATFQAFNDYLRPRIASALAAEERAKSSGGSLSTPSGGPSSSLTGQGRLSGVLAAFAAATGMPAGDLDSTPPSLSHSTQTTTTTGAPSTSSSSHSKPSSMLTRRRSSRLKARGSSGGQGHSASTSGDEDATPQQQQQPSSSSAQPASSEPARAQAATPEVLDGGVETPREGGADDRPVNFEIASDGTRVNASTPDGTRIRTPALGVPASRSEPSSRPGSRLQALSTSDQSGSAAVPSASSSTSTPTPGATRSYAAALKAAPSDWHIVFEMGGKPIEAETTIFGAVYRHEIQSGSQVSTRGVWHNIYTVTYKKVAGSPPVVDALGTPEPPNLELDLPEFLAEDPRQSSVLRLLSVLHQINSEWAETIGQQEVHDVEAAAALAGSLFVNNKLTAKLNRQLEEPMIVASKCLPDWALQLPLLFPFLFPFETRYIFLQSTSFGYARLMQKWLQSARTDANSRRDENLSFLGRLQRQKVRIARQRLFESAFKVFELYGSSKAMLEVEYFDEVGTGLGPTLEFYSLVSKEFRRKSLEIWRIGDSPPDSEFVSNSRGLFPAPVNVDLVDRDTYDKHCNVFKVLGTVVAKALMDSRITDLPFSKMFMKLVLGQRIPLTIDSVRIVDPALAQSLDHINKFAAERQSIWAAEGISDEDKLAAIGGIEVDGSLIGDMSLDFTLPGYNVELRPGGRDIELTMDNVEEYIHAVIEWTLVKGVKPFVHKFKEGFSEVFPVKDLGTFTPEELVKLFGNEEEDWSATTIGDSIKADHGFSLTSPTIVNLIDIISRYDEGMRRKFLSFATGSSRLPLGGFKGLHPQLTVVRKSPEDGQSSDSLLPSVMTCSNFLKICEYSSKEVLEARLSTAITEGAGSFHLS